MDTCTLDAPKTDEFHASVPRAGCGNWMQAKSRQEGLSIFLQAAIMHSSISRSALTLEFLTREAQEVRISLPPLSPTAAADHDGSHRGEDSS